MVSVTSFTDYDDAIRIANDTLYGLGPGCEPRREHRLPGGPRHQGRAGVDQLLSHVSAHAAFGGYKQSGIGRENHKMMLDHYQQTKNLLVSLQQQGAGFFRASATRSPIG